MKPHVLEFISPGLKITKVRGSMMVSSGQVDQLVPLDDVFSALVLSDDLQISTNVIASLIERNVPIIFCDSKYNPLASLLRYDGHYLTQERQAAQINLSQIQKGRFWQRIVRQKILNQKTLLDVLGISGASLSKYFEEVEAHDKTGREAIAAKIYWRQLFGSEFRRDFSQSDGNKLLNYGYAVVRSAVARSVTSSGLNPTIGIHHNNKQNPFCLVDDLLEPFRPIVDNFCFHHQTELSLPAEIKRGLAALLAHEVQFQGENKPLSSAIQDYVHSFVNSVMCEDYRMFDVDVDLKFYD